MGIGLVLVRQLVGLMDGELTVESSAGEGTAVRVTLPATDGPPLATPAIQADAALENDISVEGSVLYIEDNPVNAILVEQLMQRWPGVRLTVADNGSTGLERARALHPDVVLLDMQLPDIDGLAVLKALKADPQTSGQRVVALSANAQPEDIRSAREAGAADYWTKPIDFDRFIQGMRGLLRGA
jgi:hypothetical protein